jgi:predicted RND superfamily exporter protein
MSSKLLAAYNRIILGHPVITLVLAALIVAALGSYAPKFRLDASADTLVLENDQSLKYYRSIKGLYGSDDSLVLTYTPESDIFSDDVLHDLKMLRSKLEKLDGIESVVSILNVPLIKSPPVTLIELSKGIITLESPEVNLELAKKEFLTSPLYRNLLVSEDGSTTALQVNFKKDETRKILQERVDKLRAKRFEGELSLEDSQLLQKASEELDTHISSLQAQLSSNIIAVRAIMDEHRQSAKLFLGGVPMIVNDSIDFVRHDLVVFGLSVFAILVIILTIIFRRPRWVILSMVTCAVSGFSMIGMLGLLNWPVTVVSSNFVSLLLILTLSLLVHLIVRYRELQNEQPNIDKKALILETVKSKFIPCFYTSITTMVAFGSLLVSGIRPVIDFGWIMVIGVTLAQIISFTIFPAALVLLEKEKPVSDHDFTESITQFLARKNEQYGHGIMALFFMLAVMSIWGATRLTVENRFIDYYKDSTEIYQGMELIDRKLGGTTPLDVVIDAPASFFVEEEEEDDEEYYKDEFYEFYDDEYDEYGDEGDAGIGITGTSYWFNTEMFGKVLEIHDYLDDLDETGKVISLATTIRMLKSINEDILTNNFELAILYKKLPEDIKKSLLRPYMSVDGNQLRFSIRVFESDSSLKRGPLLAKIQRDLVNDLGLEDEQVHTTGMLVLYNNMLQSLFQSQILTLGVVFVAIMLMLAALFQNIKLATIAIVPNMIAACGVLGIMGWLSIPLDMMTITIAAICIGIAVDNSIHYVHRFRDEYSISHDYWDAARRSHATIGRAMYYTSLTITLGFSILAFSNFIPTIYFGLLTGFSMVAALLANMTLLPLLIIRFKPLGEHQSKAI